MLEDFNAMVSNLPEPLDEKEQEFLFYEMAKLKKQFAEDKNPQTGIKIEAIEDKLISHNLRLCADFARKYCYKHNRKRDLEDVYGECAEQLLKAVDGFNINLGNKFATYASQYFKTALFNNFKKESRDASSKVSDNTILDKNDDEVEDGLFRFLYDADAQNSLDAIEIKELSKAVFSYIESIKIDQKREILKMSLGFGYDRRYTQNEIASIYGITQAPVSRTIASEKAKLKDYLQRNNYLSLS